MSSLHACLAELVMQPPTIDMYFRICTQVKHKPALSRARINPNHAQNPNQSQANPESAQVSPKSTQVNPKSTQASHKSTQVNPKSTQVNPKSTQVNPSQSQVNPSQPKSGPRLGLIFADSCTMAVGSPTRPSKA